MGDRGGRRDDAARPSRPALHSVPVLSGRSEPPPQTAGERDELWLPARVASARIARRWVMNQLAADGVFGAENQVVELLTGELVVNAAVHGPRAGKVRVRTWRVGTTVRVAVHDDGLSEPVVQHVEPTASSGRGLALVESLAATWGIERHPEEGKTVWFSVDLEQG